MNDKLLENMSPARRSQRLSKEADQSSKKTYTDCRKRREQDLNLGEPAVKRWLPASTSSSCHPSNVTDEIFNKNITSSSCSIVPMPHLVRRLNLNKSARKKSPVKTQTAEITETFFSKTNSTNTVTQSNLEENSPPKCIQSSQNKLRTNEAKGDGESKETSTEEIVQHFWPYPHQRVTRNLSKVITKNVRENRLLPFVERSGAVPPKTEEYSVFGGTVSETNCSIVTILSDDEETQHIVEPPSNAVCDEQLINNLIKIYRNAPVSPPGNSTCDESGLQDSSAVGISMPEDSHMDCKLDGNCGKSSVVILDHEKPQNGYNTEKSQLVAVCRKASNNHCKPTRKEFTGKPIPPLEEALNGESQVLSENLDSKKIANDALGKSRESEKSQQKHELSSMKFDKSQYPKDPQLHSKKTQIPVEESSEERWQKEEISRISDECHLQLQLVKEENQKWSELVQRKQGYSQPSAAREHDKSLVYSGESLKQAEDRKLQPAGSLQVNEESQLKFGESRLNCEEKLLLRLEDAQESRLNSVDKTYENSKLHSGEQYHREKLLLPKISTNETLPQQKAQNICFDRPVSLLTPAVKTKRQMEEECQTSEVDREVFSKKFFKKSRRERENHERNRNTCRKQLRKNHLQRQMSPSAQSKEVDASIEKPLDILLSAVEKTVNRMENGKTTTDVIEKSPINDIRQAGDESKVLFEDKFEIYRNERNNNMIPINNEYSSITLSSSGKHKNSVNNEEGLVPLEDRQEPCDEPLDQENNGGTEGLHKLESRVASKTLEQEIEENKCVSAALLLAVEKMMSLVDEESKQQNTESKQQNADSKQQNSESKQQNADSKQQNSESTKNEKPRLKPTSEPRPQSQSALTNQQPQSSLEPFSVLSLDDISSSVLQNFDVGIEYGLYTTVQVEDRCPTEPASSTVPKHSVKQNSPKDVSPSINGLEGLRLSCAGFFAEEPVSKQSDVNKTKDENFNNPDDATNASEDFSKMNELVKTCHSSVEISSKDCSKGNELVSSSCLSSVGSSKESSNVASSSNSRTDGVPISGNNSPLQYNLDNPNSPPVDREEFQKQERYFSNIFPTPPEDIAEDSRFNASLARCSVFLSRSVQTVRNGGIYNSLPKEETHQELRRTSSEDKDRVEPMFSVSDCCDLEELTAISDFIKMLKTSCFHEVAAPNTILIISRHEPLHSWVYLMGIVRRLRIVTAQWVIDCLHKKYLIKNLDDYYPNSRDPGPARSQTAEHPPFEGIYICTELLRNDKIKALIEEGGATVVPTLQDFRNSTQHAFPRFFLFEDEDDLTVDVIQNLSRDSTLAVPVHLNWIYHCVSNFNSSFINEYLARCFFVHPEILIKNYRIPTCLVQLTDEEDDLP